jgi:hypothetical protein
MILTEFINFTLVKFNFIIFKFFNLNLHIRYILTCQLARNNSKLKFKTYLLMILKVIPFNFEMYKLIA